MPTLALVGSPNCGKTSLFNALTGLKRKVANYPGVTVDWSEGTSRRQLGADWQILDLPGLYSLSPVSEDERITSQIVLNSEGAPITPDLLLCVADATHLQLHLRLVLELRELKRPMVLALTMIDRAERKGIVPDCAALEAALGIPVRAVSSMQNRGLEELMAAVQELHQKTDEQKPMAKRSVAERISYVSTLLTRVQPQHQESFVHSLTDKVDRWLLHPWIGPLVLALVLFCVFQAIFAGAAPLQDGIEEGIAHLARLLTEVLPAGLWQSLIVDGLIQGVGSVVVFLPQILILFFFLLILEDSGYMARAAFLLDAPMRQVGLNGRSVLPLISGFACAVPSLMSTRIMGYQRERILTILITPLMTCSARLPVYTLLIGAFVPMRSFGGVFNLPGLVLFLLYLAGILSALLIAWIAHRRAWVGGESPFLIELPSYHWPSWRNVGSGLYEKGLAFLTRAGTFILAVVMILWFLASFPRPPEGVLQPAITYSFAGRLGQWLEPLFAPLGWNWKIVVALIPGFAAREVLVGALGMVYSLESGLADEAQQAALSQILPHELTLPAAIALLVWYIYAPQCFATFAVMRKETQSWPLTAIGFTYLLVLAYLAAWLAFQISSVLLP